MTIASQIWDVEKSSLFMALKLTSLTLKAPLKREAKPFLQNTLPCLDSAADSFNKTI
jgi:hypothetical protein